MDRLFVLTRSGFIIIPLTVTCLARVDKPTKEQMKVSDISIPEHEVKEPFEQDPGCNVNVVVFKGTFQTTPLDIDLIRDFTLKHETRGRDIFVVTHPKCGTTWLCM